LLVSGVSPVVQPGRSSQLTGFNYHFNALSSDKNELNEAFQIMFTTPERISLFQVLQGIIPILRVVVSFAAVKAQARRLMKALCSVTSVCAEKLKQNKQWTG
jgi:hypothetical protein